MVQPGKLKPKRTHKPKFCSELESVGLGGKLGGLPWDLKELKPGANVKPKDGTETR